MLEQFVPADTPLTKVGDAVGYANRINERYLQLSPEELKEIVSQHENHTFFSRLLRYFNGNEAIDYITAKEILEKKQKAASS